MQFVCDGCGRGGNEDDLCADDEPCPYYDNEADEACPGTCHVLIPELDRVDRLAGLLEAVGHIEGQEDCPELEGLYDAFKMGALALRGLAIAYRTNQLWTVDGSSGSDDAAFLYAILTDIGLEVP